MTLRRAIRDLLAGGDGAALADVPADEVAQALTNYADTASLAEADALAPIVTRASHVPFDADVDGDLGAPLLDVHAELASLDPVQPASVDDGEVADPVDGIDGAPSGNGRGVDEHGPDADDGTGEHDDIDGGDDQADTSDVDPDGWFDEQTSSASASDGQSGTTFAGDAPTADEAMAFGTGTAGVDSAGVDGSGDTLDAMLHATSANSHDMIDPAGFEQAEFEVDSINELPIDAADQGIAIDGEIEVDDGPLDDSFGDVDFDV
ncbi:hypothetical protein [Ilumatobacter coccineus]|uniref:Uncharacterized protein n=1 Tax=Ilumatobacter coccineus (strain NBRC 103263 / KCTC 29153 / YM16-304) TaxID=1313172 RepID=A0A6C7EFF2_ILUCY|nr:hypothetical protein [Ilumatobacter coccineus]BAN03899.1 hypothetical protein YM304_35850 [Ilumatobacter coccineus YM16-304]